MSSGYLPIEGVTPGTEVLGQINALDERTQDAVVDELIRQRQARLNRQLMARVDVLQNRIDEQNALIGGLAEDVRGGIDAGLRRAKGMEHYYTRTQIGMTLVPAISAPRMTRLMRAAGIVSRHGNPMAKYREGTEPLAKLKPFSEYETWLFHVGKLTARLNTWLEENDLYSQFHNTATKTERDRFIDAVYEEFAGDLQREDKR
jgi:hypothetical protein